MRSSVRRFGPLLGAVLLLSACGADSGDERAETVGSTSANAGGSATKSKTFRLNQEQVNAALLTVSDMPTGFTSSASTEEGSKSESLSGCAALDALDTTKDPGVKAKAAFKQSDFGPFISEDIAVQIDKAKENYDRFASAIKTCAAFDSPNDDGEITKFTLAALSFPNLGDETFALKASGTAMFPVSLDIAVVRLGDTLIFISNGGIGSADSVVTESVTRKAVEKVKAAA